VAVEAEALSLMMTSVVVAEAASLMMTSVVVAEGGRSTRKTAVAVEWCSMMRPAEAAASPMTTSVVVVVVVVVAEEEEVAAAVVAEELRNPIPNCHFHSPKNCSPRTERTNLMVKMHSKETTRAASPMTTSVVVVVVAEAWRSTRMRMRWTTRREALRWRMTSEAAASPTTMWAVVVAEAVCRKMKLVVVAASPMTRTSVVAAEAAASPMTVVAEEVVAAARQMNSSELNFFPASTYPVHGGDAREQPNRSCTCGQQETFGNFS